LFISSLFSTFEVLLSFYFAVERSNTPFVSNCSWPFFQYFPYSSIYSNESLKGSFEKSIRLFRGFNTPWIFVLLYLFQNVHFLRLNVPW